MTCSSKTMAVAAIRNGTVIDHIGIGKALKIIRLLKLENYPKPITLGLNLPSNTYGYKDIIKVEDMELTPDEANQVAIFAPSATINIICDYEVHKKYRVEMPATLEKVISCP